MTWKVLLKALYPFISIYGKIKFNKMRYDSLIYNLEVKSLFCRVKQDLIFSTTRRNFECSARNKVEYYQGSSSEKKK